MVGLGVGKLTRRFKDKLNGRTSQRGASFFSAAFHTFEPAICRRLGAGWPINGLAVVFVFGQET